MSRIKPIPPRTWKPDTFGEILEHLRREGLPGLAGLFDRKSWSAETADTLTITQKSLIGRKKNTKLLYGAISGASLQGSVPFYPEVVITLHRGNPISLFGLRKTHAEALLSELEMHRAHALAHDLPGHLGQLRSWKRKFDKELKQERWFSRDTLQQLLAAKPTALEIGADLSLVLNHPKRDVILKALTPANRKALLFWEKPEYSDLVADHNSIFTNKELSRYEAYFDAIEKSPLTEEQRKAVICFDNRVLVIASAGSGKTSTMVAKAGYAVHRQIVKPEEILMLAFNRSAADELDQRVKERLGTAGIEVEGIRGSTFHALGLSIIGEATGRKPRLAKFVDQQREEPTILSILDEAMRRSVRLRAKVAFLRYVFSEDLPDFNDEAQNFDAYDRKAQRRGFLTLKGDIVKSQEERIIADLLYIYGVEYEYEKPYEIDVADAKHSQYCPDFYYPEIGLYHEHFALDEHGEPPKTLGFEGYAESVRWKRQIHRNHQTKLIETTSSGVRHGRDLKRLFRELRNYGVKVRLQENLCHEGRKPLTDNDLAKTLRTFLSHVKSNRLSLSDLDRRLSQQPPLASKLRHSIFLDIFKEVWKGWQDALKRENAIDFDDMLNEATDLIRAGDYSSPYRLVLADEFQDASHSRASLVQALVDAPHHFLCAVGDDWQAIYRFAGADVSAMTEFEKLFGESKMPLLQRTFRCPQSLADMAARFVMENPRQIRKAVDSAAPEQEFASLRGVLADDEKEIPSLVDQRLQEINKCASGNTSKRKQRITVLLLGRYRHNQPAGLNTFRKKYTHLDIYFSTIHKSKGLEADHVFLLNVNKGRWGFPSTIEDDPVLLLAMPGADEFKHAEERRLFYVALTRAKCSVTLFAPKRQISPFFNEMVERGMPVFDKSGVRISVLGCGKCGVGIMVERHGIHGRFWGCDQFPECNNTMDHDPASPFQAPFGSSERSKEYGLWRPVTRSPPKS